MINLNVGDYIMLSKTNEFVQFNPFNYLFERDKFSNELVKTIHKFNENLF